MIAKFKRRRKKRFKEGIIFQILFSVLTLVLIGFLLVSNFKINQKRAELTERITSLQKEIQILAEQKAELEAGISQAEKKSYWEEKIREQGYVREGESPVVVVPPKETQKEEVGIVQSFSANLLEKIKTFLARVIQW
ncbi:MAG: septum formation initiator family protein [Candidatus Paceibacterales bacterium]